MCLAKKKNPEQPVPVDLIEEKDPVALNHWPSLYLMETRSARGWQGVPFNLARFDCKWTSCTAKLGSSMNPNATLSPSWIRRMLGSLT